MKSHPRIEPRHVLRGPVSGNLEPCANFQRTQHFCWSKLGRTLLEMACVLVCPQIFKGKKMSDFPDGNLPRISRCSAA